MAFLDDSLRRFGFGVWKEMPARENGSPVMNVPTPHGVFSPKTNTAGLGRLSNDNLWRVGTRHELVTHYNKTMAKTLKRVSYTISFLLAGLFFFQQSLASGAVEFSLLAILCAAMVSRYYTAAVGGFAGDWADYENDPVKLIPHSAYVHGE